MDEKKSIPASTPDLSEITFPQGTTRNGFKSFHRLKALILPSSMNDYQTSFRQCRNLEQLVLPNIAIHTTGDCFDGVYLKTLVYPARAIAICNNAAYRGCIEKIVMRGTNPPTLPSSTKILFEKIYVPEGSLSAYQSATNWSTLADIMEEYTEETILW